MNSSNYRFTLDMHSAQSQISIPALLGDTGRTLYISFSDGGKPYFIEDGCLAKISIKRPTKSHLEEFCTIENNTTVVYPFDKNENTCAVEGIHNCDVTLYDLEGRTITSPRFTMVVSERAINRDDITFSNEDQTAIDAIVAAEAARQVAEEERVANEKERQEAQATIIAKAEETIEASATATAAATTATNAAEVASAASNNATEKSQQASASENVATNSAAQAKSSADIAKAAEANVMNLESGIIRNEKRITNIEKAGALDHSVAYVKDVPIDAKPFAAVNKIGGMTYRDGAVLRSAKVTAVESVGANLFDKSKVINATETDTGFSFTWTGPNTSPIIIGTFKNLCPTLRAGDVVHLNGSTVNSSYSMRAFFYLAGEGVDWLNQAITITDKLLNGLVYAYGETGKLCEYKEVRITKIANAPYSPYIHATLPIPTEVQALAGYGEGNPDNTSEYNAIFWDENGNQYYSHKGDIVGGVWVPRTPEVIDISDILLTDNYIEVEGGGTITFKNEYGYSVPSEVEYQTNDAIARIGEVKLTASAWVGEGYLFSQVVNIAGVTKNSQVDLTPSVEQLAVFYEKDLAFVTENEDGVVTVYAIGQKPKNDYTIQVTITEVNI